MEDRRKWITKASHYSQQLKKKNNKKFVPNASLVTDTHTRRPKNDIRKNNFKMRIESMNCFSLSHANERMNECVFDFTVGPKYFECRRKKTGVIYQMKNEAYTAAKKEEQKKLNMKDERGKTRLHTFVVNAKQMLKRMAAGIARGFVRRPHQRAHKKKKKKKQRKKKTENAQMD